MGKAVGDVDFSMYFVGMSESYVESSMCFVRKSKCYVGKTECFVENPGRYAGNAERHAGGSMPAAGVAEWHAGFSIFAPDMSECRKNIVFLLFEKSPPMTTTYEIAFPQQLRGRIALPASKSISARALVISALAGGCRVEGLSDCDDTRVLRRALEERTAEIDILAAGTAMRFATAYFAAVPGEHHVITGTARMCQRPVGVLVDALRTLGARIEYVGQTGFPPLRIEGRRLQGGQLELPADVSSQYISALLMIAPTLTSGLRLRLRGEVVSRPYIDMTLSLMRQFGAQADWTAADELTVAPQAYSAGTHYRVEPDWSAASYWYEAVALSADGDACIHLPGLRPDSVQGDRATARLFEQLGVATTFDAEGAVVRKLAGVAPPVAGRLEEDFAECPDLAQTLVVACAETGRPFRFTGLQSLKIKETDRIVALRDELAKLGFALAADERTLTWDGRRTPHAAAPAVIDTYEDHRMAMAFAPAALREGCIRIRRPEVVSKSYPAYWNDLRSAGARVEQTVCADRS